MLLVPNPHPHPTPLSWEGSGMQVPQAIPRQQISASLSVREPNIAAAGWVWGWGACKVQDTQKVFESLKDPHTCDLNLDFLFAQKLYTNSIRHYDQTDVFAVNPSGLTVESKSTSSLELMPQ